MFIDGIIYTQIGFSHGIEMSGKWILSRFISVFL